MTFKFLNTDFPAYSFYTLLLTEQVENEINRLGPIDQVSGAYDWPMVFGGYRGWTDAINSIWWPQEAAQFATCVIVIDDARNDIIASSIAAQKAADGGNYRPPNFILQALLSPGEGFAPTGVSPVSVETELIAWKLYPLAPINLTSLSSSESVRGLWLLPLVDIRYFERNTALNTAGGSSSSSTVVNCDGGYPVVCAGSADMPGWMPAIGGYPKDLSTPLHYVPIAGQGIQQSVVSATDRASAIDAQASMLNLRPICRDVRSNYSNSSVAFSHTAFTGTLLDYPEDYTLATPVGFHQDAKAIFAQTGMRLAGGASDSRTLDDLIARKLQFLFPTLQSDCLYSITLKTTVDYPTNVSQFTEDTDGPDVVEREVVPAVLMGFASRGTTPTTSERASMLASAKQWFLIYCWWKRDQYYMRFPGIVPVIPNGHALMIRWDFSQTKYQTTYVAVEGVEGSPGTSRVGVPTRQPFYAQIDGEGYIQDNLHGFYAWTELIDANGSLTVGANSRKGYVANVNGSATTINPGRDESGKTSVPVGLTVWMKPGKVYLDSNTGQCFDHLRFTTTDLMQIVRRKSPVEVSPEGYIKGIIQTWEPNLKRLIDSKEVWIKVLS
jgi:hypothetical protein